MKREREREGNATHLPKSDDPNGDLEDHDSVDDDLKDVEC